MDLTHPTHAIVPTLEGPVLEVLAHTTRPLTGREVHRLARRGSPNGIRLALIRLTDQGVVNAEERSAAVFYTANREHLAWPAVETLTSLRRTLIERLRTEFESWVPAPVHASIFGSLARGDGDAASDIDILLIRPDDVAEDESPWAEHVDRLRQQVVTWTGNRCQAFELDRPRLAEHVQAQDPLVDSLLSDAVELAGGDFQNTLRQLPVPGGGR